MILLIDCGSSKVPYIERLIDDHDDVLTVPFFDFNEDLLTESKGVIISGAPILVTETDMSGWIEKVKWITQGKIPVLGICFGHQLIGLLHGAEAGRMKEDRDWQLIEFHYESILSDKLPDEVEMMEDHCETISVPPEFILLASSDACINEAMKHENMDIFGVQFHPEVSGNSGAVLIGNFVRYCMEK